MGNAVGLTQAYELRDFSAQAALAFRDNLKDDQGQIKITKDDALAVASLVKAWLSASDRIRILRGRPLPGSRRPEPLVKKKKSQPLPPVTES